MTAAGLHRRRTRDPTARRLGAAVVALSLPALGAAATVVTPEQHGAVADGVADDTKAVQAAIDSCGGVGDGCTLLFAGSPGYRIGPVWLVSDMLVEVRRHSTVWAANRTNWVAFHRFNSTDCCYPAVLNGEHLRNVTLTGDGVIDGDGGSGWWQYTWDDKKHPPGSLNDYRPHLTGFIDVRGLRIGGGLTLRNSPNHHIWLQDSVGARIGGVAGELSIYAPAVQGAGLPGTDFRKGSPNTDGINVAGGTDTLIESINVHNNDDCVSVVASTTWRPRLAPNLLGDGVEQGAGGAGDIVNGYGGDVIVRNISCTYSHGLSIGSVTHGIVTNVCT